MKINTYKQYVLNLIFLKVIASNIPRADVLEKIVRDDVLKISYVRKSFSTFNINKDLQSK